MQTDTGRQRGQHLSVQWLKKGVKPQHPAGRVSSAPMFQGAAEMTIMQLLPMVLAAAGHLGGQDMCHRRGTQSLVARGWE